MAYARRTSTRSASRTRSYSRAPARRAPARRSTARRAAPRSSARRSSGGQQTLRLVIEQIPASGVSRVGPTVAQAVQAARKAKY